MRICLVNPAYNPTFWDLRQVPGFPADSVLSPNAVLPLLAALVPFDAEIRLCEENVDPSPLSEEWDLVGITGYSHQARRMIELGDSLRARGIPVVMGGAQVSVAPDLFRDHADVLIVGEAERIWPRFLEDFRRGEQVAEYRDDGPAVDLAQSPRPRLDLLEPAHYLNISIQTSRGCPHDCEFCSVVRLQGHRVRCKPAESVVLELDDAVDAGFASVFIADDNLGASRSQALVLLRAIADRADRHGAALPMFAQTTIGFGADAELVEAAAAAGVESLFVGVETPNAESLAAADKGHNLQDDAIASLRRFHEHGLNVQAGMVIGFDQDSPRIFDEQLEFLQEASISVPMVSLLVALPGTRLASRLGQEGRLDTGFEYGTAYELTSNFQPAQLSREQLTVGYVWLLNTLYSAPMFMSRLSSAAAYWPPSDPVPSGGDSASGRPGGFGMSAVAQLFASIAELGEGYERATDTAFRLLMENPGHTRKLLYSLLYWRHIMSLLRHWRCWDPQPSSRSPV